MPSLQQSAEVDSGISPLVWKVSAVAILGSLLSQLDATIINVSLSSLATELASPLSTVQWVASGYLLALALVLPLSGWLVDRVGAKTVYLWSFTGFTVSSALCGGAWSIDSLIGFRILQGVSGGLLAPMAQMMVARVAGQNMARVFSYAVMPVLLGPILGPVIAGAILQHMSWRWLFLVNVPVGALAVLLAWMILPNDKDDVQPRTLDIGGLLLISPALVLLLFGLDHVGGRQGQACAITGTLLLVIFVRSALRKGDASVVDLRLFRGRAFASGTIVQFLSNGSSFGGQMLLPLYLIRVCGYSPVQAGSAMAPIGIGMLCSYPFIGSLTQRFGARTIAFPGSLLSFATTLCFVFVSLHGSSRGVIITALFLRGVFLSATGIPSLSSAYAHMPKSQLPMATTTLNICQRLGGPALTTLCAILLDWQLHDANSPVARSHAFAYTFGGLAIVQLAMSLVTLGLPNTKQATSARDKRVETEHALAD
jgi:EmrB/QacA subfamily drug resistance transporter